MTFPYVTASSIAISKLPLLALLTNVGSSGSSQNWNVNNTGYQPNTVLTDVLSCNNVTTDANGGISVVVIGGVPQVYVSADLVVSGSGICGRSGPLRKQGSVTSDQASIRRGGWLWFLTVVAGIVVGF
jgi:alpha-amylase